MERDQTQDTSRSVTRFYPNCKDHNCFSPAKLNLSIHFEHFENNLFQPKNFALRNLSRTPVKIKVIQVAVEQQHICLLSLDTSS